MPTVDVLALYGTLVLVDTLPLVVQSIVISSHAPSYYCQTWTEKGLQGPALSYPRSRLHLPTPRTHAAFDKHVEAVKRLVEAQDDCEGLWDEFQALLHYDRDETNDSINP